MTRTRPPARISARQLVPASPETIFAFLSDLQNHWLLATGHHEPVRMKRPDGPHDASHLRLRGPLFVRRTVHAQIVARAEHNHLAGRAWAGRRTTARIRWTLTPLHAATGVEVAVEIERVSLLDRTLLALGGRRWLEHRLRDALSGLAEIVRVAAADSPLDDARDCAVVLARHARARTAERSRRAVSSHASAQGQAAA